MEKYPGAGIGVIPGSHPVEAELRPQTRYSRRTGTLSCRWNCGFFSNCSVTLWGLITLYNHNAVVNRVDFSKAFSRYRTFRQRLVGTDLYPCYFRTDPNRVISVNPPVLRHDHHGLYRDYDFGSLTPFIRKYFNLRDDLIECQHKLVEKYRIDTGNTIAIHYRGTDKYRETRLADPNDYLAAAEDALNENPDSRILIQTDQHQVRELFLRHFRDRCFYLEELPAVTGRRPVHGRLRRLPINRFELGKMTLLITHLMSRCRTLITHTGNMAAWTCLFRGNANRVLQFDREGKPVPPIRINSI